MQFDLFCITIFFTLFEETEDEFSFLQGQIVVKRGLYMSMLRLLYPVHTLDNRVVLPAGAIVARENLDALISSGDNASLSTYPLLRYGSVKEDLLHFIGLPPCDVIFSAQGLIVKLLDLIEKVDLAPPLLQSLDYFRQNDLYTYRHILMVFVLSTLLAREMVSDYESLIMEAATGPTHDFGKICVPLHILKKTTPLTRIERSILSHHTAAGYVLLCYYLGDPGNLAARVARDHHERRNGSGHPRGIMLADRLVEIVAVCDIYDALISPRPYRPISYDNRTALEEITGMAERGEISWEIVQVLVALNRKAKTHYTEARVSIEKRGVPPPGNLYGSIAEENTRQGIFKAYP